MIKHVFTLIWNKRKSNFLLFLEIVFAFLILFVVSSFVIQNFRLYQTPLGFETEDIWMIDFNMEDIGDSTTIVETKKRLYNELMNQPEIESMSYMGNITPFGGNIWMTSNDDNGFELRTNVAFADRDYAKTSNLNIIEGRWFSEEDNLSKYEPVVISKKLRDSFFKEKNLYDSVYVIEGENKIIGVVDHFKYRGEFSEEDPLTFFYEPKYSPDLPNFCLKIKSGTTADFEMKLNQIIAGITKQNDFLIEKLENRRIRNSRMTWIPIVALLSISGFLILNVALGLFGVLWYNISKRKPEIGLRRALGASKRSITNQFVAEVLTVSFFGILVGAFFALQVPLLMEGALLNTDNYFYGMLTAGITIFTLVIFCAFYPSRQASSIHPAIALHEE